jgi:hypothetical protein
MVNFADEWSVQVVAKSRRDDFLEEARRRSDARMLPRDRRTSNSIRTSLGHGMIRIGEQILRAGV